MKILATCLTFKMKRSRMEKYVLLMETCAHQRSIVRYITVVSVIRNAIGDFTTKPMAKNFKVKEKACMDTVECI